MTRREERILRAAALAVIAWALFPVLWLASLSLKPAADLGDRCLLPREISLDHYRALLEDGAFTAALWNSTGIALLSSGCAVALALPAAWAIARLAFPGRRAVLAVALGVAMFPPISVVGPLFDLWRVSGLYDSWAGLVIPYTAFTLPLALWILTTCFREIPPDLERAARVDGATRLQAFARVVAPLAAPGVATAAVLVFLFAWNDFLFALSLTSTERARTVPAALAFFSAESRFQHPTGRIAAAAILVTVPVVAAVLVLQRRIVSGLTAGAVKG